MEWYLTITQKEHIKPGNTEYNNIWNREMNYAALFGQSGKRKFL